MRAPFQDGDFPFPVKYGYMAVGIAETGSLAGRLCVALAPHQDRQALPEDALHPVPDGIPARRAVLAPNMETALTIVWDSGAAPGDRIAVIGAGVIGLLTAHLFARMPAAEVVVADVDPARASVAASLGLRSSIRPTFRTTATSWSMPAPRQPVSPRRSAPPVSRRASSRRAGTAPTTCRFRSAAPSTAAA